jgi:hypothetical protein
MHVFMTGATGFLGRAAVLRLQRDGHTLAAWVRSPARARSSVGAGVDLVDAAGGRAAMEREVARADAVINLAGEPLLGRRWSERRKRALVESRVGLTEALVAAIQAAPRPPRVLLSASATGYYGDRGDEVLDEHSPPGQDFLGDLCQRWEAAANEANAAGTRVARLRIGVVLGAGGGMVQAMAPVFRAGLGGPLGRGTQYLSWIHVEDMVEILAQALTDARYTGAINCVSPQPVTNRALTRSLGQVLRRPAVLPVPALALRLALGGAARVALASQRVVPGVLSELGFAFRFRELGQALGDVLRPDSGCVIDRLSSADVPRSAYLEARTPRYLLEQTTILDAPLDAVFPFFSRAENLAVLTPPSMSFRILTPTPVAMQPGTVIDYRIGLGAVPMSWRTVIETWEPGARFVDAQHRGPYRAWWHEHHFEAAGDRTVMRDRVYYAPPLGILGRLAHRLFIRRMLQQIFDYRSTAIRLRFGHGGERTQEATRAPQEAAAS